ncbi:hypothetical protein [Paenibacillus medicaginis]|uniref:Uncharacterized protein n=1 Tax=Paenibacillus medicaginis TaxID=1470560 RepID=A0ABV5BUX9_9BACL
MNDKKSNLQLMLHSFNETTEDLTVLKATFIIHDFSKSWNGQIITKEVALENAHTLLNKPIVAKYYPAIEGNSSTDALGSHEQYLGANRYGEDIIQMNTVAVGVITTTGYVLTVNENGEDKEVLAIDGVLWRDRYSDVCDLLIEWYSRGIHIFSSVEYLYRNFSFRDGIEYIESPIYYSGHAILNSEQRGGHDVVLPSYDSSRLLSFNDIKQFNRLVAQAFNRQINEEGEKMLFRKICELSHDDIRSKIYQVLDPTLTEGVYSWLVAVYDNHFVAEIYSEESGYKYYDYKYSIGEDAVTIDFETKSEVVEERTWKAVSEVQDLQIQLNNASAKVDYLTAELEAAKTSMNDVKNEKEKIEEKFNSVSETIVSLNAQVRELEQIKEQFDQEKFEQTLNSQIDFYAEKFEAVEGKDKFQTEEVQSLIKLSVNENEEGKSAKLQLNSMLVELVKPVKKTDHNNNAGIKELISRNERLIPEATDFESRYTI